MVNNAHFRATVAQRQGEFTINLPCVGDISVGGNVQGISATKYGIASGSASGSAAGDNTYKIVFTSS